MEETLSGADISTLLSSPVAGLEQSDLEAILQAGDSACQARTLAWLRLLAAYIRTQIALGGGG